MKIDRKIIEQLGQRFIRKDKNSVIVCDISPGADDTYDLGTPNKQYKTVYAHNFLGGGAITDHGGLSGLDDDDHLQYVHISIARTITAQHQFAPTSAQAPFTLNANAQGQTVTGFQADKLNKQVIAGQSLSGGGYLTADRTLDVLIATTQPSSIEPDDSGMVGTSDYLARADHQHAIICGTPQNITPDTAAYEGDNTTFARSDHEHGITCDAPTVNLSVSSTNQEGSATYFARSDHSHAITCSYNPSTQSILLKTDASGYLALEWLGISVYPPQVPLHIQDDATYQLRIGYDSSNYVDLRCNGTGLFGINPISHLMNFEYNFSNYGQFEVTSSGEFILKTATDAGGGKLTLQPVGDIILDPDGMDVLPNLGYEINLGSLQKKYLTLHAAELWVETLVAQDTIATIGGRILVGPTTELTVDLGSSDTQMSMKHNQMIGGDIVYLEANAKVEFISIGNGYAINLVDIYDDYFRLNEGKDLSSDFPVGKKFTVVGSTGNNGEWTVDSTIYSAPLFYVYTVEDITDETGDGYILYTGPQSGTSFKYLTITRNLDGSGANDWYAGDAVFNTGQTGNGFIDLYSVRGVKAASQSGPTIVGNVRNSSTYNDWTEHWAIGNLNGLYDYGSTVYGFAAGKYSTTTSWISADATAGIRIMRGTTQLSRWYVDGSLLIGQQAASQSNIYITSGSILLCNYTTQKIRIDSSGYILIGQQAANQENIYISSGAMYFRQNTTQKIKLESDGDVFIGTNVGSASGTRFAIFTNAQTFDGVSYGVGDVLIGRNTSGSAAMVFDTTYGTLGFYSEGHSSPDLYLDIGGDLLATRWGIVGNYYTSPTATYMYINGATAYNKGIGLGGTTVTGCDLGIYTSNSPSDTIYGTICLNTPLSTPGWSYLIIDCKDPGSSRGEIHLYGNVLIGIDSSNLPSGGAKGRGTVNAKAFYDDGTQVTDFVFEPEYQLMDIDAMSDFMYANKHLPTIPGRKEWEEEGGFSLGKISNHLWETIEAQAIYISQLHDRIKKLEEKCGIIKV